MNNWEQNEFDQRRDEPRVESQLTQSLPKQSLLTQSLVDAFHEQLQACLEECAAGRRGLFTDQDYLAGSAERRPWPEAARLRDLAMALQSVLAQQEENDPLCDQFLDLCTIHGEHDPGESKLARAFLAAIAGGS